MAEPVQSFQSHTRWYPPFHYFVLPILFANLLYQAYHVFQAPSFYTVWGVIVALGLLALAVATRQMVISVQDRVIRSKSVCACIGCCRPSSSRRSTR